MRFQPLRVSPAWRRYSKLRCGVRGCAFVYLHASEVESDFCHCGSGIDDHGWSDNHSPVPMIYPAAPHSWERETNDISITDVRSAA